MKHLHVSLTTLTAYSRSGLSAYPLFQEIIPPNTVFNKQFLDLLKKIFVYDPKQRITAKQALKHPWFKENIVDDGTEAARIRMDRERERLANGYHG